MADAPFNHTPIGFLERPVSKDHNQNTSQIYRTIRDLLQSMLSSRASDSSSAEAAVNGFIGGGFRVTPSSPAAMSVQITPGFGFIYAPADVPTDIGSPDMLEVDDLSKYKPLVLLAPATFAVTAPAVNPRIDIIEVKVDRRLENSIARRKFDAGTEQFAAHSYFKTLAFEADGRTSIVTAANPSTGAIGYKIGVEGASPSPPSVTAGYVKIGEVRTGTGTTSIAAANIGDFRNLLHPGGVLNASITFRLQYNAGTPILTILKMVAPPSVEIGIDPIAGRGQFRFAVIGGNFTGIAWDVGLLQDPSDPGWVIVNTRLDTGSSSVLVHPLNATDQANYAANFTPPLAAAQGQSTSRFIVQAARWSGTDFLTTDVLLEDVIYTVNLQLGYF